MGVFDAISGWSADVLKAEHAPRGFTPIPGSKHGGWHKKTANGWETWYPGVGVGSHPKEKMTADQHEAARASLPEETRQFIDRLSVTDVRRYDPEKKPAKQKPAAPDEKLPRWKAAVGHLDLTVTPPPKAKNVKVLLKPGGDPNKGAVLSWVSPTTGETILAYTQEFARNQAHVKWARLATMVPVMAKGTASLRKQITNGKTAREKDAALALAVIEATGLRPGSAAATRGNKPTFGVTTLRPEHVTFTDGAARLEFVGKASKVNKRVITDPLLVAQLRDRVARTPPGEDLFKANEKDVSATTKKHYGKFKTKDLRTMQGSMKAAEVLAVTKPPKLTGDKVKDRKIIEDVLARVSAEVSDYLGNTPAVARQSYVHPSLFVTWMETAGATPELVSSLFKGEDGVHPFRGMSSDARELLEAALRRARKGAASRVDLEDDGEDGLESYPVDPGGF